MAAMIILFIVFFLSVAFICTTLYVYFFTNAKEQVEDFLFMWALMFFIFIASWSVKQIVDRSDIENKIELKDR